MALLSNQARDLVSLGLLYSCFFLSLFCIKNTKLAFSLHYHVAPAHNHVCPPQARIMSVLSKPLPADHLLSIFSRVSVPTLLRLPLTCTHWHSLQPTACRQTHSLALNITDNTPSLIPPYPFSQSSSIFGLSQSTLTISHKNGTLPEPIAHSLLALFLSIHNLNLENNAFYHILEEVLSPECSTHSLSLLLGTWAPTLIRLGIYGFKSYHGDSSETEQTRQTYASTSLTSLLSTINTLPTLKHLTIDLQNILLSDSKASESASLRISIISRLQSLFFTSYHLADILLPSLRAYARPTLLQLDLGSGPEGLIHLLAKENSPILNSLTHTSYFSEHPPGDFIQIAAKLRNLTNLTLYTDKIHAHTLRRLLQALANCLALRNFHLNLLKVDHSPVNDPLPALVPLPWVTIFTLQIRYLTTHSLLSDELSLPWLLPNLAHFTLGSLPYSCTVCPFTPASLDQSFWTDKVQSTDVAQSTLRACVRQQIGPLKECRNLKSITVPNFENAQTWHDLHGSNLYSLPFEDFPIEQL